MTKATSPLLVVSHPVTHASIDPETVAHLLHRKLSKHRVHSPATVRLIAVLAGLGPEAREAR